MAVKTVTLAALGALLTSLVSVTQAETKLEDEIQSLKQNVLDLNRDLLILEEELLFPANSQLAVYLSVDVGQYFQLDAVTLKIDGKEVSHYLYTDKQVKALRRGGVQRLYLGNLRKGDHEITAIYTGYGPNKREYKRGASTTITKDLDPAWVELRIEDEEGKQQPEFTIKHWDS